MIDIDNTKHRIRSFLFRFLRDQNLSDDQNLFEIGAANSLFSIQLIMYLEKEFQVIINNKDLNLNNFQSVNAMTDFIIKKLKDGGVSRAD